MQEITRNLVLALGVPGDDNVERLSAYNVQTKAQGSDCYAHIEFVISTPTSRVARLVVCQGSSSLLALYNAFVRQYKARERGRPEDKLWLGGIYVAPPAKHAFTDDTLTTDTAPGTAATHFLDYTNLYALDILRAFYASGQALERAQTIGSYELAPDAAYAYFVVVARRVAAFILNMNRNDVVFDQGSDLEAAALALKSFSLEDKQ